MLPRLQASIDTAHVRDQKQAETYDRLKNDVQSHFCDGRYIKGFIRVAFLEESIGDKTRFSEDGVYLTRGVFDRLIRNVATRGFKVERSEGVLSYGDGHNQIVGCQVKISLPEEEIDESGYTSDGWDPSFKASRVEKNVREAITKSFNKMKKDVEDEISQHSDVSNYRFRVEPACPPEYRGAVAIELAERLSTKGFTASTNSDHQWTYLNVSRPNI